MVFQEASEFLANQKTKKWYAQHTWPVKAKFMILVIFNVSVLFHFIDFKSRPSTSIMYYL